MTVTELLAVLKVVPPSYAVVLCADDAIEVMSFRVAIDHDEKVVRLTNWE